ncbi:protein C2-DOMAIN ABA-RELATED 11-like isoform X2 [Manihot esculenta]|uniref:protein C2-DOMAIN ABA-RELATED 11-like isoform X2 n=1 Tax=Manihot esculenta TaxID=3983 RepID=UPI001CC484A9|nr:protein C2-DOMAIN ABA-RELATED 11-like isoform X2 [Manihot esculenta]XP_043805175.1 protein C2-DOMAIN ABA-RELATED 11-like isoform X2 [Manihot esculenta]XP_043805176.1 protein C2-DOMAIN ABA-RELATED 11-like isoform X2 [Manihot esculenta]XP_043805177.1 protein C2-DOMAIN ABA-RELATED 11-like isoform X2 [Manihot esculenta]
MGEQVGLLKVTVVQGKKLVIRDFKSSDPYVVVKLGNQEVFDKDRFKADDKMGHAQLNLQPIVSAARLKQILQVCSGETILRKAVPDSDNCLARESSISCINGEVVQSVWLRLCAVESGEIELKIKLIDRPVASSR